jgi:hypothetical protein
VRIAAVISFSRVNIVFKRLREYITSSEVRTREEVLLVSALSDGDAMASFCRIILISRSKPAVG